MLLLTRRVLLGAVIAVAAALALACTSEERPAAVESVAPLYVAIGASDSVGTGARNPAEEGWVPVLHGKMPPGTRLANLGIGGLLTAQSLDQALPVALDLQPAVGTVWLGVNDYAGDVPLESYRADLDTLVGGLTRGTRATVYVANLPDLTLLPAFHEQNQVALRANVELWNAAIAGVVEANGAQLVDLYAGWSELRERREYISRDGLHPSTRGHRRLAELFWAAIQGRGVTE